jgi:hypothetical protein
MALEVVLSPVTEGVKAVRFMLIYGELHSGSQAAIFRAQAVAVSVPKEETADPALLLDHTDDWRRKSEWSMVNGFGGNGVSSGSSNGCGDGVQQAVDLPLRLGRRGHRGQKKGHRRGVERPVGMLIVSDDGLARRSVGVFDMAMGNFEDERDVVRANIRTGVDIVDAAVKICGGDQLVWAAGLLRRNFWDPGEGGGEVPEPGI